MKNPSINELQIKLSRALTQRDALKQKIADKFGSFDVWRYKKHRNDLFTVQASHQLKLLQYKIASFKRQIKRRRVKWNEMKAIHELVCEYFDLSTIRFSGKQNRCSVALAWGCFAKYMLENTGVRGGDISLFLGSKYRERASKLRLRFTRSFQKYPERSILYQKVSQYISVNISSPKFENHGKDSQQKSINQESGNKKVA